MYNSLITTIIPTYKRNDFIERAILSVENQSYDDIEIIVVDDNEPDSIYRAETEQKIKHLQKRYNNIRYIKHDKNKGAPAARNTGILSAHGDYIAFLDDDDYWKVNKIEEQIKYIYKYDVILSSAEYIDADYNFKNFNKNEITKKDLKYRNCGGGSTSSLLIKKSVISQFLFDTDLKKSQDYDLYIRLSYRYKIKYIADPLVVIDFDMSRERISTNKLYHDFKDYKQYHIFYDKHRSFFGDKLYKYHLACLYLNSIGQRNDKLKHFFYVLRLFGIIVPTKVLIIKSIKRLF